MLTNQIQLVEPRLVELPPSFWKIFKKITRLAIPMGFSFTFSWQMALAVYLSKILGETEAEIAAGTLIVIYINIVGSISSGPLFGAGNYLGGEVGKWRALQANPDSISEDDRARVEGERARVKLNISSSLANTLLIGAAISPFSFLALFYADYVFTEGFHQNKEVAAAAQKFIIIWAMAIPGLMARTAIEQPIFALGETPAAMGMGLFSLVVVGVPTALALGFGVDIGGLHIPRMGMPGVAIGFVVESYLTPILFGLFVRFNKRMKQFDFFTSMLSKIKNNFTQLKAILRFGGSSTFTITTELMIALNVGICSGLVGVAAQEAMTFVMQFMYLELIMSTAFGLSCSLAIRNAIGEGKHIEANRTAIYGLLTALIYLVPFPIVLIIRPEVLEYISGGAKPNVSRILKQLVPVMSSGFILDTVGNILRQQLRGMSDLVAPNVIATIGSFAAVALVYSLGLETSLEINGVGIGYAIAVTGAAFALLSRWCCKAQEIVRDVTDEPPSCMTSIGNCVSSICSRFSFFRSSASPPLGGTRASVDTDSEREGEPLVARSLDMPVVPDSEWEGTPFGI